MSDTPLVAIHCLVYNHEPYLRQCLDGFVMQKTSFPFVAVVHDDASTDRSADIIRDYAARYPQIIQPIYETENQYTVHGLSEVTRIMDAVMENIGAKYIAACEGDDYWTDLDKLQKQVDFLEAHPEYVLCCHRYTIYNQNDNTWETDYIADYFADGKNPNGFSFTRVDCFRCWIPKTNTLMFRRTAMNNAVLQQYRYTRDVHRIYHLLQNSSGYCLPFSGSVYRRQEGGIFARLDVWQKQQVSFRLYAELLQKNPQDAELATFFNEISISYFDALRRQVQKRHIDVRLIHDIIELMRIQEKGMSNGFVFKKLLLSFLRGVRSRQ